MNAHVKSRLLSAFGVTKKNKHAARNGLPHQDTDTTKRIDQSLAYWREQLNNAPSLLDLSLNAARLERRPSCNTYESLSLSPSLSQSIDTLAEQQGISRQAILLAGFFTLLYRYTGQEDIIVVSPYRGNNKYDGGKNGAAQSNLVLYRWSNSGVNSFHEAVHNLQQTINTIWAIGPIPIQDLVDEAGISGEGVGLDNGALHQLAFDFNEHNNSVSARLDLVESRELFLSVGRETSGLVAHLHYDGAAFNPATVRNMLLHYHNLLDSAVSDAAQSVSQLSMLSQQERQKLLCEWNNSSVDFPVLDSVHELFEASVAETPDAEALVFNDARLSYKEINKKANQLAHYLHVKGVSSGTLVGIYMDRCADSVIALLGVLKAGGAYLPLDASYPKDRLKYILQDAGAQLLLTHERFSDDLEEISDKLMYLDSNWDQIAAHRDDNPENLSHGEDTAFVLYTSGSTGNPKGVEVTHSNLTNYFFIWEHTYHLRASISAICQMTFFSFAVFQGDVIRALCSGNKLVLCSRELLMSPRKLLELMHREKIDFAEFVPVLLRGLVDHVKKVGEDLRFMKVIVVGADRWYLREHREVQKLCASDRCLVHVYGLSETTLDSTFFTGTDADLSENQMVPIGRPFPNVHAYILDSHRQPVPIGVAGELYIGGCGVAKGYHNRPQLSAEKFVLNRFSSFGNSNFGNSSVGNSSAGNDRLFSTGDYARYLEDGNIAFLGRRDQQLKIRGFRVEIGEIEARMEQHPAVKSAIIQPWEPSPGVIHLVGYYVVEQFSQLHVDEIRRFLAESLPDFMVPSHFVKLESVPLTPSCKINRNALPLPPNIEQQRDTIAQDCPDELQLTITQMCSHALGITHLNPDDVFDRIGADSMAYMTMVSGMEDAFGIVVEEDEINDNTFASVNSLTAYVKSKL